MDQRQDDVGADEGESAAAAFENLRAEVVALRGSIDAFPAAVQDNRPPDYAPTLGAIVKAIHGIEKRLAIIEAHPAIRLTPEQHGRAMERAGAAALREAMETFRNEATAISYERRQLGQIVGAALERESQRRWRLWFTGAGVIVGFILFPAIAIVAPAGTYLAALAAGEIDRWQAGGVLMQAESPEGWREFVWAANFARANTDAIRACREAAAKAGKEQKCAVVVSATSGR